MNNTNQTAMLLRSLILTLCLSFSTVATAGFFDELKEKTEKLRESVEQARESADSLNDDPDSRPSPGQPRAKPAVESAERRSIDDRPESSPESRSGPADGESPPGAASLVRIGRHARKNAQAAYPVRKIPLTTEQPPDDLLLPVVVDSYKGVPLTGNTVDYNIYKRYSDEEKYARALESTVNWGKDILNRLCMVKSSRDDFTPENFLSGRVKHSDYYVTETGIRVREMISIIAYMQLRDDAFKNIFCHTLDEKSCDKFARERNGYEGRLWAAFSGDEPALRKALRVLSGRPLTSIVKWADGLSCEHYIVEKEYLRGYDDTRKAALFQFTGHTVEVKQRTEKKYVPMSSEEYQQMVETINRDFHGEPAMMAATDPAVYYVYRVRVRNDKYTYLYTARPNYAYDVLDRRIEVYADRYLETKLFEFDLDKLYVKHITP